MGKSRAIVAVVLGATFVSALGLAAIYGPFQTPSPAGPDAPVGHIGLVLDPTLGEGIMGHDMAPLLTHLEKELAWKISPLHVVTMNDALKMVVQNKVEAAVLPALACVQAQQWGKAQILALQSFGSGYSQDGYLVVQASAPEKLSAFRGTRLCTVQAGSTLGYLAPHLWLRSHGIDSSVFFAAEIESGTHGQALKNLREDRCQVAAVSEVALAAVKKAQSGDYRILATTGHLPTQCWITSAKLGGYHSDKLLEELLAFNSQKALQRQSVGKTLKISSFREVNSSTFNAVFVSAKLSGLLDNPARSRPGGS